MASPRSNYLFARLPDDVVKLILSNCGLDDLAKVSQVNRRFHRLVNQLPCALPLKVRAAANPQQDVAVDIDVPVYVKGTYAHVRDFLNKREETQQLLAREERRPFYAINRETPGFRKTEAMIGFGSLFGGVAGILCYYLAPENITSSLLLRWLTTVCTSVATPSTTCGVLQLCYMRDQCLIHNRSRLHNELNEPSEHALHGATIDSNQPEVVANPYYVVTRK